MMARPAPLDKPRAGAARAASHAEWRDEIVRLDGDLCSAIATTPTPELDRYFRELSRAADHSKLWIASAGILAAAGGQSGRRAAVNGLASIAATSAVVNLVLKPLSRRRRPDRRRSPDSARPTRANAHLDLIPVRARGVGLRLRHRRGDRRSGGGPSIERRRRARILFAGPYRSARSE